jgi:putative transposase
MPATVAGVLYRAKKEHWQARKREGRGGGLEYATASLPDETRAHLLRQAIAAQSPTALPPAPASAPSAAVHTLPARAGARPLPEGPAPGALARAGALAIALDAQDPRDLKERQKQTAMARLAVLRRVAEIRDGLQVPLDAAIAALNEHVAREPGDTLARLLAKANARPRETGVPVLTRASFYRWSELEAGGYARLAPQPTRRAALPPWAATFLRLDGTPQRHSLSDVVRQLPKALAADGIACPVPTERQVRWFYGRHVGQLAKWHGRLDARELRNKMPFVRRDFSMLKPADIYTSDGHTFKAMVRHPDQPNRLIRPEVTPVLDVATRKVVGWSASFRENQWDVLAALRQRARLGARED